MNEEIFSIESQIVELQRRRRELRGATADAIRDDYVFQSADGAVTLRQLFSDSRRLLVVHNMGVSCLYCQAYADGFNGVLQHLLLYSRFVVASADPVETQRAKAAERNWKFFMISTLGTTFTEDLGFSSASEGPWPGISALQMNDDGSIVRIGMSSFEPGDAFSPIWPALQLFDVNAASWEPGS